MARALGADSGGRISPVTSVSRARPKRPRALGEPTKPPLPRNIGSGSRRRTRQSLAAKRSLRADIDLMGQTHSRAWPGQLGADSRCRILPVTPVSHARPKHHGLRPLSLGEPTKSPSNRRSRRYTPPSLRARHSDANNWYTTVSAYSPRPIGISAVNDPARV